MSWTDLSAEVSAMFAEHTWRADDIQAAIEGYAIRKHIQDAERRADPWRRKRAVEGAVAWARANPKRKNENNSRSIKRWKEREPEEFRVYARNHKRRQVARNREHYREVWKRNSAAYRARKKAQMQSQTKEAA